MLCPIALFRIETQESADLNVSQGVLCTLKIWDQHPYNHSWGVQSPFLQPNLNKMFHTDYFSMDIGAYFLLNQNSSLVPFLAPTKTKVRLQFRLLLPSIVLLCILRNVLKIWSRRRSLFLGQINGRLNISFLFSCLLPTLSLPHLFFLGYSNSVSRPSLLSSEERRQPRT